MADYSGYSKKTPHRTSASAAETTASRSNDRRRIIIVRIILLLLAVAAFRLVSCAQESRQQIPQLPEYPSIEEFHDSLPSIAMPDGLMEYLSGSDAG